MAYPNPIDLGISYQQSGGGSGAVAASADLTVPAGKRWDVRALQVALGTSATVGNRRLAVSIYDGSQLVFRLLAGITQAASLAYGYTLVPGAPLSAAVIGDFAYIPFPPALVLGPGYKIKVSDVAAIDAATDSYLQTALVVETGL